MTFIYQLAIWATKTVAKLGFSFKSFRPDGFQEDGPLLIAANHVSYFDPPLVAISFKQDIHFLARNTLYSNAFARWLFPRLNVIPVDQEKAEVAPLKTVIRLLKEKKRVLVFPEGGRSRDGKLQPAQGGAGFIVAKTGAPVVPMRIFGAHEALPPGEKKIKRRKITVVVGNVMHFSPEELTGGKAAYQAISERIMAEIAKLECPPDRIPKPR